MPHPVASIVSQHFYWVFLAILFLNLYQRKYQKVGERKRFATLYLAMAALVFYAAANLLIQFDLSGLWLIAVIGAIVAVFVRFRHATWPFRLRCQRSGERLDMETILFRDSNILPRYEDQQSDDQHADDRHSDDPR